MTQIDKKLFILSISLACTLSFVFTYFLVNKIEKEEAVIIVKSAKNEIALNQNLRKLWADQATWTYKYIISNLERLFDNKFVLVRLLNNQEFLGSSISNFFGTYNTQKFIDLMKEHVDLIGQLIEILKSGSKTRLDNLTIKWQQNAEEIAQLLASVNPNWKKENLIILFNNIQAIKDQIMARLHKKWDVDIKLLNKTIEHNLHIADVLTEGIVKQFPDKFN